MMHMVPQQSLWYHQALGWGTWAESRHHFASNFLWAGAAVYLSEYVWRVNKMLGRIAT